MKIELPWRSVPPAQSRMLVGTLRTRTSRTCTSWRAGCSGLGPQPRSTWGMRGAGRAGGGGGWGGVVGGGGGVVGLMRVVDGRDVGQHHRPHIVVLVGGDAHELRAFDQKRGMPRISDADLVRIQSKTHAGGGDTRGAGGGA